VVLDHVFERGCRHDHNGMSFEVMQQLALGDENSINELLDLWVTYLSV
jgi:hypothetical protein